MKRTLLLWVLLLGCICAAFAQPQMKIYIDGREATVDEWKALPRERIGSIRTDREDGQPVMRIALKQEGGTHSVSLEGKRVLRAAPDSLSPEERWYYLRDQLFGESTLLRKGDRAADFTAERYDGGTVASDDFRGKTVLVCFWGTWCRPCLEELARLPAVLKPYLGRDDFVLLAAALDDREALDRFFASEKRAEYRYLRSCTLLDGDRAIFRRFATESVPRSVLIDREGVIAECTMGNNDFELERLRRSLAKLFE